MTTTTLTVDTVRAEILDLCDRYPERTGALVDVPSPLGRPTCTYLDNRTGAPVCIVGTWLHDLHPDLLDNDVIAKIVEENESFEVDLDIPLDEDVQWVLREAQELQDGGFGENPRPWGEVGRILAKRWKEDEGE